MDIRESPASGTLIAAPIVSAEVPLIKQLYTARTAGAHLAELRVDRIGDAAAVADVLAHPRPLPVIVTVRSPAEGGEDFGGEANRQAAIVRLAALQPDYLDVELATWEASDSLRQKLGELCALRRNAEKTQLILSHHDFARTPADLAPVFDRLLASPADVIKAVFTAADATDGLRVLAQAQRAAAERPVIALAMGEAGLATRVLARKFRCLLTFATISPESGSAPGQPAISDLRGVFRWEAIGPATRVFGVVGWPVAHSQSPQIHNAAMAHRRVDGVYVPLPVQPEAEALAAFLDAVTANAGLGFRGFSVTIPHKEHALRWLEAHGQEVSELARRAGAVNTLVWRPEGVWFGDNTDAAGALAALDAGDTTGGQRLQNRRVAVLGAGGVARAVVAALLERECQVTIYNRTRARAAALAEELGCAWAEWEERVRLDADIVINCTSVGLWPNVEDCPLPGEALRPGQVVFDTVYRPERTRLLRLAEERGCRIVSGIDMFLRQAAEQYRLWHGEAAPIWVMRASLRT